VLLSYVAVRTEPAARALERYFKSGSGKAFAAKRLSLRDPDRRFEDEDRRNALTTVTVIPHTGGRIDRKS
jgi:hypothetical protein